MTDRNTRLWEIAQAEDEERKKPKPREAVLAVCSLFRAVNKAPVQS